ncbi:MAG: tetratricopeptide repeat protein [Gammaproteobacteria bacterium]|nr:tetratricopeptide repeat protein [Gammaproteobacteria bacterium]MCP5443371.1 tetratricopeptide repeat protein [Chromatiaceae bacterium]
MESADTSQKQVLVEANKLVSGGLRKAAIDLLLEYLGCDSNSAAVLSALGRAYLLDRQPEKAVTYLKKSLEISQAVRAKIVETPEYGVDDFDDDDMAFVESQAVESSEEVFDFEYDEPKSPGRDQPTFTSISVAPVLSDHLEKPEPDGEEKIVFNVDREITDRLRTGAGDSLSDQRVHARYKEHIPRSATQRADSVVIQTNKTETIPQTLDLSDYRPPQQLVKPATPAAMTDGDPAGKHYDQSDDKAFQEESFVGDDDNEESITEDLFSDEIDEEDEDLLDELAATDEQTPLDEELEELGWEELEDLDEFDAQAHRPFGDENCDEDGITREHRAKQIAVEVLTKSDWDPVHLPLLQQVFIENGWSAARAAIERAIERGLLPEELAIAREIRLCWAGNEQFWTTFHKIKSNAPYNQADAAYKHMSWVESLRIVECFPCFPDIEEVYGFIDEAYETWYNSDRLRRIFKAFFKYLKYRTGSMRRSLPGDIVFSFYPSCDTETGSDSHSLLNAIAPESQDLAGLGIYLNQWPRAAENKMRINKEIDEEEGGSKKQKKGSVSKTITHRKNAETQQQNASFGFGSRNQSKDIQPAIIRDKTLESKLTLAMIGNLGSGVNENKK